MWINDNRSELSLKLAFSYCTSISACEIMSFETIELQCTCPPESMYIVNRADSMGKRSREYVLVRKSKGNVEQTEWRNKNNTNSNICVQSYLQRTVWLRLVYFPPGLLVYTRGINQEKHCSYWRDMEVPLRSYAEPCTSCALHCSEHSKIKFKHEHCTYFWRTSNRCFIIQNDRST